MQTKIIKSDRIVRELFSKSLSLLDIISTPKFYDI